MNSMRMILAVVVVFGLGSCATATDKPTPRKGQATAQRTETVDNNETITVHHTRVRSSQFHGGLKQGGPKSQRTAGRSFMKKR